MSCHETQQRLAEIFGGELSGVALAQCRDHIESCADCSKEFAALQETNDALAVWQDEPIPQWAAARLGGLRDLAAKPSPEPDPKPTRTWPNLWQWLPTAASFAMLVILLVDLRVVVNDTGFTIAFGAPQAALESAVDSDAIDSLLARFEQRQDQNNLALMQAVLTQTREANAASFTQLLTYFEEQRLRDMDELRVSYEQLVSTDYETVRSLQQLANFVSYGETVR